MEPLNDMTAAAWAYLVGLFYGLRLWWVGEESGPTLLLGVRMFSAVAFLGAGISWRCLSAAPIFERTWSKREARTFRLLAAGVCFGAFACAAYFVLAGVLEAERTSSPHRLIVGNAAFACLSLPLVLLGYFLRLAFARKAVDVARQAVEARYRTGSA